MELNALNTGIEARNEVTSSAVLQSTLSFPCIFQQGNKRNETYNFCYEMKPIIKVKWKILFYTAGVVGFDMQEERVCVLP